MNKNAFSKYSSIVVGKTESGKISDNVGFSRTDGPIMPIDERIRHMEKNGLIVEKTPNGIFVTKII